MADRPIRMIVPYAPGATGDIGGRLYGEELSKSLGQTVVIDNKTGAGGTIAMAELARAPPDGYTLGVIAQGLLVYNLGLYKNPGYDPFKDLVAAVDQLLGRQRADRASVEPGQDRGRRGRAGARQEGRVHLFVGRRRHQPSHVGRAAGDAHRREDDARALSRDARRHPGRGQRRGGDGHVQHADRRRA